MEILSKCKSCPSMEKFISFDKREDLILHFLCESAHPSHYRTLPFLKSLSKYDTYERLIKIKAIAIKFSICASLLFVMTLFTNEPMLPFFIAAVMVMTCYMLYQLVSDDIGSIRIYELSFSNKTFEGLKGFSILNKHNRLIEIKPQRNFDNRIKDKSGWRISIYLRALINYFIENYDRRRMVVGYLFKKKETILLDALSTTEAERNLMKGIQEAEMYLKSINFKISKIYLIKSEDGDGQVWEITKSQIPPILKTIMI